MEQLFRVPNVELWQVKNSERQLLATGDWSVHCDRSIVTSTVGGTSWQLTSSLNCLKAQERSYVFAIDAAAAHFYCVNLPREVSEDDVLVVETTLESFAHYEIATGDVQPTRTDQLVQGLGYVTEKAVAGMAVAAGYVGDAIVKGAKSLKRRSEPCDSPKPISETTKRRVQQVRDVAKMASGVAGAAVDAMTTFTSKAADAIVGSTKPSDPQKTSSKIKRVAAAVVVSAADVYEGMIKAAYIVSQKTVDATKDVVTHRYGEDAGQLAEDGMTAVGHSANTIIQSSRLGTKAIIRSTARKTAVGYMGNSDTTPSAN